MAIWCLVLYLYAFAGDRITADASSRRRYGTFRA